MESPAATGHHRHRGLWACVCTSAGLELPKWRVFCCSLSPYGVLNTRNLHSTYVPQSMEETHLPFHGISSVRFVVVIAIKFITQHEDVDLCKSASGCWGCSRKSPGQPVVGRMYASKTEIRFIWTLFSDMYVWWRGRWGWWWQLRLYLELVLDFTTNLEVYWPEQVNDPSDQD